jgi:hypothetical protein
MKETASYERHYEELSSTIRVPKETDSWPSLIANRPFSWQKKDTAVARYRFTGANTTRKDSAHPAYHEE